MMLLLRTKNSKLHMVLLLMLPIVLIQAQYYNNKGVISQQIKTVVISQYNSHPNME